MKYAVLVVSLLTTACMPVVQHGPWVQRGYSGNLGASGGASTALERRAAVAPFFSFEGAMRVGITPNDSSHSGAAIGLQLPLLAMLAGGDAAEFLNLDGYFTGPDVNELNTAAGITASGLHYMRYVQVGRYDAWYGTLGVMFARDPEFVMFAPSFTNVERQSPGSTRHVTLTAGVGSNGDETLFMAGFTLIFEWHRVRP